MQDRFQPNFSERVGQSQTARIANLEAFKSALASDSQNGAESYIKIPKMPSIAATNSQDSKVSSYPKPLLSFVPRRFRTPILAATAGVAALGAAACSSGNNTEVPLAPTNQGEVLGVAVTPVPSISAENTQPAKKEFKQAWDFTLKDKYGIPLSLHDLGNRPVIIEYSEANCPPCRRESNKLSDIMKKYASQGLVVLNVSIGTDANFNPSVPLLLDPNMEFATEYGIAAGVPATIFIRDGKVVYTYFDSSEGNIDLDKLSEAFMQGKDLDGILPTATLGPTETSTPVVTKEKISSDEAVFDLGNFDLGVKEWEDLTNVHPYQIEIGGKTIDVKTVVVKAIFRSKADKVVNLIDSAEKSLGNVSFVDSSGKDIEYFPGSGRVNVHLDEPLKYGGAINEPFVQNLKGDFIAIDDVCSSKKYTLDRFTAGFGIPVSIIATVPLNVRDYGIAILEPGASKRKIVMKNEAATDFKTIADDVPVHDPDYVFRLQGNNGEYVDSSFKGLQRVQYSPGFPPDTLARFHFIDRLQANPFYYFLLQGNLFLKDGRVLQIGELAGGSLNFGQEGDLQGNVGGINPENKCPLVNPNTLRNAYGFDLKGSIAVLNFDPLSVAWRVQDNASR